MPIAPLFNCFVGQPRVAITRADTQWCLSLPADRTGAQPAHVTPAVTYGDYFTAVCDYLSRQQWALPVKAAGVVLEQPIDSQDIQSIDVHLIKHGAFYHPALVTLILDQARVPLVLNVAVSAAGRNWLSQEADHLLALGRDFPQRFVPRIYGWGHGGADQLEPLPMFAGQWFADYHELHRTRTDSTSSQRWSVWDEGRGRWILDQHQVADFFRQAAFILTYYFDPHALNVIHQWHHAAGDFVVKKGDSGIDVRLITVRRYAPLLNLGDQEFGLDTLLRALAIFLVKTSLWMRLDRLDGVGELVWADTVILQPIWKGFVQGLRKMAELNEFPDQFVEGVLRYLAAYTSGDFYDLGLGIIERYPEALAEVQLIKTHMADHANHLAALMQAGGRV